MHCMYTKLSLVLNLFLYLIVKKKTLNYLLNCFYKLDTSE